MEYITKEFRSDLDRECYYFKEVKGLLKIYLKGATYIAKAISKDFSKRMLVVSP